MKYRVIGGNVTAWHYHLSNTSHFWKIALKQPDLMHCLKPDDVRFINFIIKTVFMICLSIRRILQIFCPFSLNFRFQLPSYFLSRSF
jgi:hypothetical protein